MNFKVLKSFLHRAEFLVTGDLVTIEPDLVDGLVAEGWIAPVKQVAQTQTVVKK
jgi:hypothetical protein